MVILQRKFWICMKIHHPNKNNQSKFNLYTAKSNFSDNDLEIVAENLVNLAKSRLPNHVMTGVLQGCEEDIRQEAVLLALKWFIKNQAVDPDREETIWNAAQAICAALKYCKLNAIEKNTKEQKVRTLLASAEFHSQQVGNGPFHDEWSPAEIRQILEKSIQQALKIGLISHANASIAMQVYVYGISVTDLAKHLKRSKSAVHQQLNRVNKAIPEIIQAMRE